MTQYKLQKKSPQQLMANLSDRRSVSNTENCPEHPPDDTSETFKPTPPESIKLSLPALIPVAAALSPTPVEILLTPVYGNLIFQTQEAVSNLLWSLSFVFLFFSQTRFLLNT